MQESKRKVHNGFEYYGEFVMGDWVWYFRPVGGPIDVQGPRSKLEYLKVWENASLALQFYMAALAYRSDVVAAQEKLTHLQASILDFSLSKRGDRLDMNAALRRLADAQHLAQLLADQPFDLETWKRKWLP